jgi:hypothetical protein
MPIESYTLAQDALDSAFLNDGARSVPASCVCGNDLDGRMLVVRDRGEEGEVYDTLVQDDGTGDGPSVLGNCWMCDRQLLPDTVILRDRKRRSEQEIRELAQVA